MPMTDRTAAPNQPGITRRGFFQKAMATASVAAGTEFLTGMAETGGEKFVMLLNIDRALGTDAFVTV